MEFDRGRGYNYWRSVIEDMKEERDEWYLKIVRTQNGYYCTQNGSEFMDHVIEDSEEDGLKSHEELLWFVMEHFSFYGSKHDKERLRITREKRED